MPALLLEEKVTISSPFAPPSRTSGFIWQPLIDAATASPAPFGQGIEIAIHSETHAGTALLHNGRLLHLSAFLK